MENEYSMESGIQISDLFKIFKRCFVFMICAALICGTAAGLFTEFFVDKQYAVTLKFKVKAVDNTGSTGQNLSVACVPDIIELVHNDTDLAKAILSKMTTVNEAGEEVGVATTPQNVAVLQNSITTGSTSKSSVFTVTLTNTDPNVAFNMAVAMSDVLPEYFSEGRKVSLGTNGAEKGSVETVRGADMANYKNPVYPHVLRTAVIFAFLGAVACYGIFFLVFVLDTTIHTEDDLKQVCEYPILGLIPSINPETNKAVKNGEVKKNV